MADRDDRRPVLQSLLDRLIDDDPGQVREVPISGRKLERALHDAMRRDVEVLLNSRCRCVPLPDSLRELRGTIADYGIPDFVGRALSSDRRRKKFIATIEECLREHEPRFKSVELLALGGVEEGSRSLHFRIDAVVFAEPAPESLVFDSRVEPISRSFSVEV